jgi:hypothetical protein
MNGEVAAFGETDEQNEKNFAKFPMSRPIMSVEEV